MYKLPYVEFYITNVCNLNCTNCNRFNNYAFAGHQRWADNKEFYQQWAEILDVQEISILGGEPLHKNNIEVVTDLVVLFKKQLYDEIKSIQISGTNLGKIIILKKN